MLFGGVQRFRCSEGSWARRLLYKHISAHIYVWFVVDYYLWCEFYGMRAHSRSHVRVRACVRVCVCVRAFVCACACVRARMRACVCAPAVSSYVV
jgi:hypothetical protein